MVLITTRKGINRAVKKPLPLDPDGLTDIILSLKLYDAQEIRAIFQTNASNPQRKAHLRPGSKLDLTSGTQRIAAVAQIFGVGAETPCSHCQAGKGSFVECILLDGYLVGGCANCYYDRAGVGTAQKCSNATQERKLAAHDVSVALRGRVTMLKNHDHDSKGNNESNGTTMILSSQPLLLHKPPVSDYDTALPFPPPASEFHLMGDLYLPSPSSCDLPGELLQLALKVQRALGELSKRNLGDLPDRIDLSREYEVLRERDAAAWKSCHQTPEKGSEFVKPSGSLESQIAHHLNQPSMTTSAFGSEETADPSNGCTTMIMKHNAFRQNALMFDHIHRRSCNCEDIENFPPQVLQVHEDFTKRIMASSAAKVEIVYGQKVRNRFIKVFNPLILPLWGNYDGILLGLVPEHLFHNAQAPYEYRKAVLFAAHPQFMFGQKSNSIWLKRQDDTTKAAVLMADPDLEFNDKYYQSRAFMKETLSVWERAHQAAEVLSRKWALPIRSEAEAAPEKDIYDSSTTWEGCFDPYPHSNKEMRELLPYAIKAIENCSVVDPDWTHPSQFPEPVLKLFKGLKEVVFHSDTIHCSADAIFAMQKSIDRRNTCTGEGKKLQQPQGLRSTLYQLMKKQQEVLSSPTSMGTNDDLFHSRFDGTSIQGTCACGKLVITDEYPKFGCRRPGHYVQLRTRKCKCNGTKAQDVKPLDPDLPYINFARRCLVSFNRVKNHLLEEHNGIRQCLLGPSAKAGLPDVVEIWCIRHKDKTEAKDGSIGPLWDTQPRFTIGNSRHLYVERAPVCYRCSKERGGTTSRFVPKDPAIPSIERKPFAKFSKTFEKYDPVVKAQILDAWPPSSREPRSAEDNEVEVDTLQASHPNFQSTSTPNSVVLSSTQYVSSGTIMANLTTSNAVSTITARKNSGFILISESDSKQVIQTTEVTKTTQLKRRGRPLGSKDRQPRKKRVKKVPHQEGEQEEE